MTWTRQSRRTAGLVVAAVLVACSSPLGQGDGDVAGAGAAPDEVEDPVVVVVSVDGLSPTALDGDALGDGGFVRLSEEGRSTTNARTALEQTVTLPNHTAMLTGRRILGDAGTSVTINSDPGTTIADVHGSYVPGIFDVAHDHGLATALMAQKSKFDFLVRSWDERNGAADAVGADDGADKVDRAAIIGSESRLVDAAVSAVATGGVRLAFLHLSPPDVAGHASGWRSRAYSDAVARADAAVARLLTAVSADPDLRDRTTVLVTADHGGRGRDHSDATLPANYTIPFYVWGRGVSTGDLYDVNPARRDPGTRQVPYDEPQPVRNLDVANLALDLLDLPLLPSYADGPLEALHTS